jgi:tetratricopeptide (TPR) repeat protein
MDDEGLAEGLRAAREGRTADAIAALDAAITSDPTFAKAYLYRGHLRAELGDDEAALADFTHVTRLQPERSEGWNARGRVCFDRATGRARSKSSPAPPAARRRPIWISTGYEPATPAPGHGARGSDDYFRTVLRAAAIRLPSPGVSRMSKCIMSPRPAPNQYRSMPSMSSFL